MEPYLRDNEIADIFARRWTVDCLQMQVLGQRSGEVAFEGAGAIRFSEEGNIEYVVYDTKNTVSVERILGGIEVLSGEWLEADHFYRLKATDWNGRTWTAEWLDADTHSSVDVPGAVVRGRIRELRCTPEATDVCKSLDLFAQTSSEIPTNAVTRTLTNVAGVSSERLARNVWKTVTSIGAMQARKSGDLFHVAVETEAATIPIDASLRLEEAVSFVLGSQIQWTIERRGLPSPSVVIRDIKKPLRLPRLRPPVEFTEFATAMDADALFLVYLSHLLGTSPGADKRHPVAVKIQHVLRASSAMLEGEALAVSVQVDSMVREYFAREGQPESAFLASIERILEYLAAWSGDEDVRNRVASLVGNMKGSNTETALKRLAVEGLIEERHWKAWRALRHPSAHGAVRQMDVRKTVTQSDMVFDLLLMLIFRVISYTGKYTDHTARGWPLRQVPAPPRSIEAGGSTCA